MRQLVSFRIDNDIARSLSHGVNATQVRRRIESRVRGPWQLNVGHWRRVEGNTVGSFVGRWGFQRISIAGKAIPICGDPRILAIEETHGVGKLKSARRKRAADCAGTLTAACRSGRMTAVLVNSGFPMEFLQLLETPQTEFRERN